MTTQVKSYALVSVFALATGALFMSPSSTQACTQDNCRSPLRLFSSSAPIPGDLLYFEVLVDDPGVLSLRTKDGEALAASVRMIGDRRVFAPTQTVPAGTTVVLNYSCTAAPDSQSLEYTTGPAIGLPKLSEPELTIVDQTTSGERVSGNLRYLEPSPESASHLTHTDISVDGMELSRLVQTGHVAGSLLFEVSANCTLKIPGYDTCGTLGEVSPGRHEVSVRTTVVGVETQPNVVKLSIDLNCPPVTDYADAGPQATDAGTRIADASTRTTDVGALVADGSVLTTEIAAVSADGGAFASEGPFESRSDGCAVRMPGASSGWSWVVLASGVALVLRTRSRRLARDSRKA